MAKLPYEDLQAMKELLNKAGAAAPASVPSTRPDYDTNELEDIGYEAPTQEQTEAPGFQAASKYLKNSQPIVGTKAAELLGAYRNQENSRIPASEEPELTLDETPSPEVQTSPSRQDTLSLLDKYKSLLAQRDARNMALDIGSAANRLGSAIAGKGATGGDFLQGLKKQSEQPIQDLLAQGKVVDTDNELQMSDPNSDISKFARERAVASATKMGIPAETVSKLENMSAKQLEKLGLYKNTINTTESSKGQQSDLFFNLPDGRKVIGIFDPSSKRYYDQNGELIPKEATFERNVLSTDAFGNKISFGSGGANTIKSSARENKSSAQLNQEAESFKPDREQNKAINEQKKRYDSSVKPIDKVSQQMENLVELMDKDNKMTAGYAANTLVRASGEVGAMTEGDKAPFLGSIALMDVIDQKLQGWGNSTLTPENKKEIKQMIAVFANNMQKDKTAFFDDVYNSLEQQHNVPRAFSQKVLKDIKPFSNTVNKVIQREYPNAPTADKVKVILPDGRTGMIPKENLQKALEKGAKEVK